MKKKFIHNPGIGEEFFLTQGSLDGACGLYCICMALLIKKVITPLMISDLNQLHKTNKLIKLLNIFRDRTQDERLYGQGLGSAQIQQAFRSVEGMPDVFQVYKNNSNLIEILRAEIDDGHPLMVSVVPEGSYGHWVLAIGYAIENNQVKEFFVRDPGGKKMSRQRWNNKITIKKIPICIFNGYEHEIQTCISFR